MSGVKKFISLFLVLTVVLGLCACGGNDTPDNGNQGSAAAGLQVGYARESILPDGPVNLAGSNNIATRISTGYLDIIYATCIAATENGNTVLLFSTDLLRTNSDFTKDAIKQINEATGVPAENIMIAATHAHAAPAPDNGYELTDKWKSVFTKALLNAAKKAIADQAPTTLYGTKVETENMTFVRHYKMGDGSYAGSNFGDESKGYVSYATEADKEMVLIKMDREGDKKDIALMNFQAHPCFEGGTDITADFIGKTRDAFEAESGMHFIYFTGAAGNLGTNTKLANETALHNQGMAAYGQALAKFALDALPNMEKIEGAGVQITNYTMEYACNKYGQDRLEAAQVIADAWYQSGDHTTINAMAKAAGFTSVYEATGIVNCAKYPESKTMNLNAVRIGDFGMVFAPYEMFCGSGMFIKENSPFKYTAISTCSNHHNNYFPTEEAFDYGCYESYTALFARGVAEAAADQFVTMLKSLQ